MRKHRPKDVKGIAEGHIGTFVEEIVLQIGTTVACIVFLSITLTFLDLLEFTTLLKNLPLPRHLVPREEFCLGVFTDTLDPGSIVDVMKQELMISLVTFHINPKMVLTVPLLSFLNHNLCIFSCQKEYALCTN